MGDARTEAVEAMYDAHSAHFKPYAGFSPLVPLEDLLDAIPTAALVRLLIDRGGLEQVVSAARALLAFLDGYAVCRGCGVWVNERAHHPTCLTEALRTALDRLSEEPT